MDSKKLISELSSYKQTKSLSNSQIEKDLGLPQNSLSNFFSFKKDLPKKWIQPLIDYLNISKGNDLTSEIELKVILGDLADKVTTADKIPVKDVFKETPKWFEEIEIYCEKEGITPEDLILSYRERNKPQKSKKGIKGSNEEESSNKGVSDGKAPRSNWFNDYRKNKTGIKD